jgi:hypothetical protein
MKGLTKRQKIVLSSSVAILIILLLFVLSKNLMVSANRKVSLIQTPTLSGPYAEEIGILETNVAKSPNEEVRSGEEKRLQMVGREATLVAEARNVDATQGPSTLVPTQFIRATVQAIEGRSQKQWGIIDNPSVPMSGAVFRAENAWKYDMGDGYILVIAGYSPANPDEGILLVDIDRKNIVTSRTFKAPGNSGSIRIVKAVGMRLVLETHKKDTLYFDVPGLKFVNSLEEVAPTATELVPVITPIFMETPLPPYP